LKLPRLYPILDTEILRARGYDPISAAESLVAAGVGILQFRHMGTFDRSAFAVAEAVASLCRRRGVHFILNDRADFAMLLKAGLHLGQDDLPPADAHKLMTEHAIIGYSTHNEEQLRNGDREPVTYLAIGPVFATASKERPDPFLGTGPLAGLRRLTSKPLVAIGGITRVNAREVLNTGIDSVAVIGDLYPEDHAVSSIAHRAEEWLKVTDES
jgi:thiamine-phosphate pyrophosphorylase